MDPLRVAPDPAVVRPIAHDRGAQDGEERRLLAELDAAYGPAPAADAA